MLINSCIIDKGTDGCGTGTDDSKFCTDRAGTDTGSTRTGTSVPSAEVLLCQNIFQVVLLDKYNITQFAFNISLFSCCHRYRKSSQGGTILATPESTWRFSVSSCVSSNCAFEQIQYYIVCKYRLILLHGGRGVSLMLISDEGGFTLSLVQNYRRAC